MLRSACIFLAAILLPSLVLAWLAVRSARDQQVLIEHQQAIISQDVTDSLAKNVRNQIDLTRSDFVQIAQNLLDQNGAAHNQFTNFDQRLCAQWPPAEVGFAVDLHGTIYSPKSIDSPAARTFREENDRFLSNRENVEAYSSLKSQEFVAKQMYNWNTAASGSTAANTPADRTPAPQQNAAHAMLPSSPDSLEAQGTAGTLAYSKKLSSSASMSPSAGSAAQSRAAPASTTSTPASMDASRTADKSSPPPTPDASVSFTPAASATPAADSPQVETPMLASPTTTVAAGSTALENSDQEKLQKLSQVERSVSPLNSFNSNNAVLSNTVPEESDFRKLIGTDTSGAIARFLDNKLQLLVWYRPPTAGDLILGAELNPLKLIAKLSPLLQAPELQSRDNSPSTYCLALLDDTGHPVALSIPGFITDWKHPFVATEIGETLPHWEAALYLTDPQQFSKSARTLRLTVVLIVLLLMVAIVAGGSLIAADIRRQVRVAQQKTDFVSNVSHELKTPLTSIRMFADLLAEGRVTEPERQTTYLKIISAESARLTRLINNVLDFARQERGISPGERRACDLVETTRDVVETCLPHLEAAGQNLTCEIEAESLPIIGDRDALAQIVLNLVSNAEKYGGGEILVRIRRQETSAGALGCVDVLDHGPGIPPKQVESIFLPFHRLDDSLSSGIPGSGLGLTLARRMARVHHGDITYNPRAGGGSCFTLTIPLTKS